MQPAGKRRHRVTLQRQLTDRDELGQLVGVWTEVLAGIPANVVTLTAAEAVNNNQIVAGSTHLVTMLWRTGIDATMRLLWAGQTLNIVGVMVDERKRDMVLSCKCAPGGSPDPNPNADNIDGGPFGSEYSASEFDIIEGGTFGTAYLDAIVNGGSV